MEIALVIGFLLPLHVLKDTAALLESGKITALCWTDSLRR